MRFELEQVITGPVEAVARVYTEPRFYELLGELPKLGRPEVLDRREDGSVVHLAVRFRFTGNLSPAVTRVVDPARLSWVEESVHDLERHTVTFHMKPDNYADRLRFDGSSRFEPCRQPAADHIERRREDETEGGDPDHAGEHGGAERLAELGARADRPHHRRDAEDEG